MLRRRGSVPRGGMLSRGGGVVSWWGSWLRRGSMLRREGTHVKDGRCLLRMGSMLRNLIFRYT